MPGYSGTVQHEYNKIGATFGKAVQSSYIEAMNFKSNPRSALQTEEQFTANDYYVAAPDPRKKTNSKNRSNLTLGDPRAQTFDTINMTTYRMRDLPMTRAPLVDGFAEMDKEKRDEVYRKSLQKCGVEGVRRLEHDIRVKIEQRTSGGPFALRKAFKYFDRDGSGDIDPDEFYAAMDWFGLQFTEEAVLALFGLYDEDRGGSLGYYEFVENLIDGFGKSSQDPKATGGVKDNLAAILTEAQKPRSPVKNYRHVNKDMARQAFDYCDKNMSGRIELDELDSVLKTLGLSTDSDMVNNAMLVLDTDQSGDVSFEEFWEWWEFAMMTRKESKYNTRGGVGDGDKTREARHSSDMALASPTDGLTGFGRLSPMSPYNERSAKPVSKSPAAKWHSGPIDVLEKSPISPAAKSPGTRSPTWNPPKAGSPIRKAS